MVTPQGSPWRLAVAEYPENTRALVVEDDPNIVDLIRSNLAVRGFDTVVSVDGDIPGLFSPGLIEAPSSGRG